MAPIELYRDQNHACPMFTDLIEEDGQAIQANQFLIVDDDTGAVLDPGGNLAFNELFMGMRRFFHRKSSLTYWLHMPTQTSLHRWIVGSPVPMPRS